MSNSLRRMARYFDQRDRERANGMIQTSDGLWRWIEPGEDTTGQIVSKEPNGTDVVLAKGPAAWCHSKEWGAKYPVLQGITWLPLKVCRACPFYEKAKANGHNYPTCKDKRDTGARF
jgi:hypothetical protein